MTTLAPSFTISTDLEKSELRFSASGFWNKEAVFDFVTKLGEAAMPFIQRGEPFYAFADYTGAVAQKAESGEIIRKNIEVSAKLGLKRIAVIGAIALVKLQYERLSPYVDVAFFDDKVDALRWLRANR